MEIKTLNEIIEHLLEKMDELKEHADPRGVLIDIVRNKTEIIFTHLYKIYGFGEYYPDTVHHWCAEVAGHLISFVYKQYKHSHKYMPIKDIIDAMKSKYVDVREFSSIGGELYSEYGYSKHKDSEMYKFVFEVIPPLVEYLRSLEEDEKPNIEVVEKLIRKPCEWL